MGTPDKQNLDLSRAPKGWNLKSWSCDRATEDGHEDQVRNVLQPTRDQRGSDGRRSGSCHDRLWRFAIARNLRRAAGGNRLRAHANDTSVSMGARSPSDTDPAGDESSSDTPQ